MAVAFNKRARRAGCRAQANGNASHRSVGFCTPIKQFRIQKPIRKLSRVAIDGWRLRSRLDRFEGETYAMAAPTAKLVDRIAGGGERAYVIEKGWIKLSGAMEDLKSDAEICRRYLAGYAQISPDDA